MSPQELALAVQETVTACQHRVLTVGADQYSEGDRQKFESMRPSQILAFALEEAYDLVNYGVMMSLRLKAMQRAVALASAEFDLFWTSDRVRVEAEGEAASACI